MNHNFGRNMYREGSLHWLLELDNVFPSEHTGALKTGRRFIWILF